MSNKLSPTWIWYPGDFEIWLRTQVELRRQERGMVYPPIWQLDTYFHSIEFRKTVNLSETEPVKIFADGKYNVRLDGKYIYEDYNEIVIPMGRHEIVLSVVNEHSIPSIYVTGNTVFTDGSWEVSKHDNHWNKAGSWNLDDCSIPPSRFRLPVSEIGPVKLQSVENNLLVDFGKQTFGYLKLTDVSGAGNITLYYGESIEEAMSKEHCETLDRLEKSDASEETIILETSRSLRYVQIEFSEGIKINGVSLLYEYLPLEYKGEFKCSNEKLNRIWNTGVYTLHLNTREFMLDGIKRDRWVWCGDAYQSYLMNYYIFFDEAVNRRTMLALRGKDPVDIHLNTIMDYSFYWFIGLYDYYLYTGDLDFIRHNYDKMLSLMEFCLKRRNSSGMMEGLPGDWVFIDWADISKDGEVSTEQILLCRSLEVMHIFSNLLNENEKAEIFHDLSQDLNSKIIETFWDNEQGGLINNRVNGYLNRKMTRHPNIFALLFDMLDEEKRETIKNKVLLNDDVPRITTPYFRFYELASLCEIGEHAYVTDEILNYWGGMLDLGATTFWEEFKPDLTGSEHYAMYDRPFGKSLCHAWGASPIYLLGKYYLGVKPLTASYRTYAIEPHLGGLEWIEGTVPAPNGKIHVYMDSTTIKIISSIGTGYLRFKSSIKPSVDHGVLKLVSDSCYELEITENSEYIVKYA